MAAQNSAAIAIGISAPTDPHYSATQLTVTVNGLPSDGTVYLANGTTAVTAGQTLTVAQLTGLTFKPTTGAFGRTSTFTYSVKNPAGLSTTGNATLAIGPDTIPPVTTAASLTVAENAAATAIGIAAPTDPNYNAAQLTVTVNGLPSDGTVYLANGTTAVTAGKKLTVAQLTGLMFKPTPGAIGKTSTFNYTVRDPAGLSTAGSATLAIGTGTTPPATTAASLTVAENAAATAIGIAAPTDANYSATQLTVTVNGLPSDGTVYLADGTTAVTTGETLTVAQLTGLTFKPTTGQFSQSSTFTYTVTDPAGLGTAGSATLAIGAGTAPPATTAASLTVAENAAATAIGIAAPTDPNYSATQLTVTVNGLPSDGTVYLADGTTAVTAGETLTVAQLTGLTFKPAAGQFSQSSTFTYTVTDPAGLSTAGSATLAIGADTTPPATAAASLTVAENAAATAIGIAAPTDANYSATQLTVTVNGLPSDGTVYLANGTTAVTAGETLTVAQLTGLTFKPTAGQFSQSSTFTYTVTDPAGLSTAGSATLAIGADTTPPATTAASLTVAENAPATAIGIAAPTDPNYSATQLTVTVNGLPSDGTVYLANGTTAVTAGETLTVAQLTGLTFKPAAGQFSQSSTFTYTVTDPAGLSTAGSATLAIGADTTPPATTAASLTVAENAAATAIGIAAPTDANYSATQLTVTVNGLPSDGTVYLANGTTAVTAGETLTVAQLTGLTFKPAAGQFSQSSTFTYTVTDPAGLSTAGSATLAIGADTTPPATTAASLTVAENAAATAIGIAAPTDANYSATQLTVTVNGLPSDGTVYLANGTTAVTTGETLTVAQLTGLTFKPTTGQFSQSSTFTYTVKDPAGLSTAGSATLAIGADTTPPATTAASLTVAENAAATAIGITAPTDPNYSATQLTVTVNGLPSDGTVYLANGTTAVTTGETLTVAQLTGLTFKPAAGQFSQSSAFTYTVKDPAGLGTAGSATLAIGADTTPPVTTAASLTVAENASATAIGITAPTDANYSATQLTVTVNGLPSDGTVYLADGTTAVTVGEALTVAQLTGLTFKPTAGQFSQSSTFSYTVTDPAGLSTAGSASLAIGAASGGGIVFDNTFGAGVSSAYQSAVLSAEAQISSLWTNPITLNLTFDAVAQGANGFLASNSWPAFVYVSYAQLKSALASHATSSYAASAVAALPSTDPNPTGGADWALPEAYARMLGLSSYTFSPDAIITVNTSYGLTGQALINTLEHEVTEGAMGRVGGLGDQNGVWSTMDLFRYTAAGVPDYTDGRDGKTTYFSYNGGTTLSSLSFNNQYSGSTHVNGGDTADFAQQDVFGTGSPGETIPLSATDIQVMDVLGWNPSGVTVASSSSLPVGSGTGGSAGSTSAPWSVEGSKNHFDLALLRNYMASTFVPASNGLGGPLISEDAHPSFQPTPLTSPHHPHTTG
jgi:hypothetical protein